MITPIRQVLKDKVVVSVVAGYPFEKYEEILEPGTHHISTVPNTPVSIGEGIIICEAVSYTHLDVYKRQTWCWPEQ